MSLPRIKPPRSGSRAQYSHHFTRLGIVPDKGQILLFEGRYALKRVSLLKRAFEACRSVLILY